MFDLLSTQLEFYAIRLRQMIKECNQDEIFHTRDQLRQHMVEGYRAKYWKDKPEKLREYMQLLYHVDHMLPSSAPSLALAKGTYAAFDSQIA